MIKAAEGRYHTALAAFNAARLVPPTPEDLARYRAMTPEERVALVGELTQQAWARTGVPWPRIPRAEWPVRIIRRADDR